jgi:hypothetical protein
MPDRPSRQYSLAHSWQVLCVHRSGRQDLSEGAVESPRVNPGIILLIDIHPFLGVNRSAIFDLQRSMDLAVFLLHPLYNLGVKPHDEIHEVLAKRPDSSRSRNSRSHGTDGLAHSGKAHWVVAHASSLASSGFDAPNEFSTLAPYAE